MVRPTLLTELPVFAEWSAYPKVRKIPQYADFLTGTSDMPGSRITPYSTPDYCYCSPVLA